MGGRELAPMFSLILDLRVGALLLVRVEGGVTLSFSPQHLIPTNTQASLEAVVSILYTMPYFRDYWLKGWIEFGNSNPSYPVDLFFNNPCLKCTGRRVVSIEVKGYGSVDGFKNSLDDAITDFKQNIKDGWGRLKKGSMIRQIINYAIEANKYMYLSGESGKSKGVFIWVLMPLASIESTFKVEGWVCCC